MKIIKNKNLKEYTTFKIGGKANFFVDAKSINDIVNAVSFARNRNISFVILGNGSNILVDDKGYRGMVIKVANLGCRINGNMLECQAGTPLSYLVSRAASNSLSGVECLVGIPGTLGGAIVGNAGTKNKSISKIIRSVKILQNGKIKEVENSYFKFSYRDSKIKKTNDVILAATLELKKSDKTQIEKIQSKILKLRKNQPKGYSAGSIFKNPKKIKVGELIEKAGLKGLERGGAQISSKHANFIINKGKATSSDIKYLISKIQKDVFLKFGVLIEREIRYLGEKGWE